MTREVQRFGADVDIAGRSGLSRCTIWRNARAGLLPPPVRLGPNTTRWLLSEIEEVERARIAGATDDEVRELVRSLVAQRKAAAA